MKLATKLQKTLYSFGVSAKVENVSVGPAITRYELKIYLGICFFAQDGEIIFCSHNPMPVSLWRWRRQGEARSATMLEGQIKTTFRQKFIPLVSETPYLKVDDGLYQCKINWGRYQAQFLGL